MNPESQKDKKSAEQVTMILNKSCQLLADKLVQTLPGMFNEADDLFFGLVQKSDVANYDFYFNAMREVRLEKTAIENAFKNNLVNLPERNIEGVTQDSNADDSGSSDKLEEDLAIRSITGKVSKQLSTSIILLDKQVYSLLESVREETVFNPLTAENICKAFQQACESIKSGMKVKLILFKLFEKHILKELEASLIYIHSYISKNQFTLVEEKVPANESPVLESTGMETLVKKNNILKDKNYFLLADRIIKKEIYKRMGNDELPNFVNHFMYRDWSKLLLKIYIKEGVESKAWLHAMEVIDDLVNCIGNQTSINEKLMLKDVMPNLIQRIKFGMNVIAMDDSGKREFISELLEYHKKILKNAREELGENKAPEQTSEDVTVPSFRTTVARTPFMDELLVDNKPFVKNKIDLN